MNNIKEMTIDLDKYLINRVVYISILEIEKIYYEINNTAGAEKGSKITLADYATV